MATKRIVFNEETNTLVVLGRKSLHLIELSKFESTTIASLGEDGAETHASKFGEVCKNFED